VNTDHTHAEPADEFDCPMCRTLLLEAFRSPVKRDEIPANAGDWAHRPEHSGSPFGRGPLNPSPGEQSHTTWSDARPHADRPGGTWFTGCSCGWFRDGEYTQSGREEVMCRIAASWAARHRAFPLEGTEDK